MSTLQDELGITDLRRELAEVRQMLLEMRSDPRPEYYTIDQAAEAWQCHPRTVSRRIAAGEIPVTRRGKRPLIHRDHVSRVDPARG